MVAPRAAASRTGTRWNARVTYSRAAASEPHARPPHRQEAPLPVSGGLGVRSNDLHVRARQVGPVADLFRVPLADDEDDGGDVWKGPVRVTILPIAINEPGLADRIGIGPERERDHIGREAVDHRA